MGKEFTELEAWQKAQKLALLVCREVIPLLPAEEKYALAQQLRRAVQSAPANIAEGHGRYHYQDAIRFCYIARGSLQEALSQLLLSHDLGYIPDHLMDECHELWRNAARLLNGYVEFLRQSRQGERDLTVREGELGLEYEAIPDEPVNDH